jgi:Fic family protein
MIGATQKVYYKALAASDKKGSSTLFIEHMLGVIDSSLKELLSYNNRSLSGLQRIEFFIQSGHMEFTRKDYMNVFKDISSATASRDLVKGIELKLWKKKGKKNRQNTL